MKKIYTLTDTHDGNDTFEIEAETLLDAAIDALDSRGWSISGLEAGTEYRLFSAAPDLLTALSGFVRLYQQGQLTLEGDEGKDPLVSKAIAAIAKANNH